jgi:hypothetical protein
LKLERHLERKEKRKKGIKEEKNERKKERKDKQTEKIIEKRSTVEIKQDKLQTRLTFDSQGQNFLCVFTLF